MGTVETVQHSREADMSKSRELQQSYSEQNVVTYGEKKELVILDEFLGCQTQLVSLSVHKQNRFG